MTLTIKEEIRKHKCIEGEKGEHCPGLSFDVPSRMVLSASTRGYRARISLVRAANWFPCRGEWLQTTAKAGDFYLTAPGPAYELKSSPQGVQPLRVMLVRLSTSLMVEAMTELFDKDASRVHLRDVSGFKDPCMSALMEKIRAEFASERRASRLLVRGIAQTLAVHIARSYSVISDLFSSFESIDPFKALRVTLTPLCQS